MFFKPIQSDYTDHVSAPSPPPFATKGKLTRCGGGGGGSGVSLGDPLCGESRAGLNSFAQTPYNVFYTLFSFFIGFLIFLVLPTASSKKH